MASLPSFSALDWLHLAAWVTGILAAVQAVLLVIHTVEHGRYLGRRLTGRPWIHPSGHAAVFVPCKGVDLGLAANLRPLFEQDYADYRLVFIVQSRDDPACALIWELIHAHPHVHAQLIVAGRASKCGQKVHGLLRATEPLPADVRYLAFADSDVCPSPTWLRQMIERLLTRPDTGAVTGYRWMLPQRSSLSALLVANLNNAIAALFTSGGHHLLWGGCWAIRRELFDSLGIRAAWQGVLSDDLAASTAILRAGLRIKFEPLCMLPTRLSGDASGMFEFLYRQHFMLSHYAPRWSQGLLAAAVLTVGGYALPSVAALAAYGSTGRWPAGLLVMLGLVYALQVVRGLLRAGLARRYFPEHRRALAASGWFDTLVGPLPAAFNLVVLVAARFGRRVQWRQIGYTVDRQGTVISVTHGRRAGRRNGRHAGQPQPAAGSRSRIASEAAA